MSKQGKNWPRILVAIPMERTATPTHEIFYSFMHLAQSGMNLIPLEYTRCDMSHNFAAARMMVINEMLERQGKPDETFTHLLSLDIDHTHPPDIVHRMAQDLRERPEIEVLSGMNVRRCEPFEPCAYIQDADGHYQQLAEWDEGIMQVDRVGAASLCIAATVFERLRSEYPWFRYEYGTAEGAPDTWQAMSKRTYPGPDIYWSKLCEKHNIPIYVDTRITSPHLRIEWSTLDTWKQYQQSDKFRWDYAIYETRLEMLQEYVPEIFEDGRDTLYIGANKQRAHYATEMGAPAIRDLLEIEPENCAHYLEMGIFDSVIQGDVRDFDGDTYDTIFWWHGPEHINPDELAPTLANLEDHLNPGGIIVLGAPWGATPYEAAGVERHYGNHVPELYKQLGYECVAGGAINTFKSALIAWKRKDKT